MIISEFKTMVCAFINRDPSLFATGSQDKLLAAINMAKAWAQRSYRFERAKTMASLTLTQTAGGLITTAVNYTTQSLIKIRNIERAFLVSTDGGGLFPVDLITRDEQISTLSRANENVMPESRASVVGNGGVLDIRMVRVGNIVNIWPWPATLLNGSSGLIVLDVVEFLPEYSATVVEDFFLVECQDWLLFRTLFYLNIFLKEDEKLNLSHKIMDEAWQAVKEWDTSLIESGVPVTLD